MGRKTLSFLGILLSVGFFAGLDNRLTTSHYSLVSKKVKNSFRILHLSDIHSCAYGPEQEGLLDRVRFLNGDLILLTGDIFDEKRPMDKALLILEGLKPLAPCFYVTGNHEARMGDLDKVKDLISKRGVKVLDGRAEVLSVQGNEISLMGIDDPLCSFKAYKKQLNGLKSIEHPGMSILLAHRPDRIKDYRTLNPDLIFSGHAHGGQWRFPYLLPKGLYAPGQGIFPNYTQGLHHIGEMNLVISRGLSRESTRIPRLYNPPELVCIDIDPEL